MFGVNCQMETIEWGMESVSGMIVLSFSSVQANPLQDTLNNAYSLSSDQVSLMPTRHTGSSYGVWI